MKRYVIAFLLVCAVTAMAQQRSTSVSVEYKFVYQCDEKKTNALATEGWELADMSMTAYGSLGVATCVFKRPK